MSLMNRAGYALLGASLLAIAACSSVGAPAAGPEVAQTAVTPSAPEPEWLARLNYYRHANGLAPVTADPALSEADLNHARYLVKNRIGFGAGGEVHNEDRQNQWYTPAGYAAGHSGNVMQTTAEISESAAIERWMGAPFHGLSMLAPDLKTSGFGRYCEPGLCAAVLSVGHIANLAQAATLKTREEFDYNSDAPDKRNQLFLETPVRWPAPGVTISDGSFDGREWPNPLSACPGYTPPTGAVIFASFGRDFVAEPQPESLACDGAPVEHCMVTAKNYQSPDSTQLDTARQILQGDAAALLIPRMPLKPGSNCQVSLMVDGTEYQWSFSVRPQAPQGADDPNSQ
ncbi:MAG: CAP domain-containing protein [Candidatus Binataceae bacterium]